jgi:aminoglycoside phosphotransferase (APT) family kinase protein
MEALDGLVLRDRALPPLDSPLERTRVGHELVDALAELHAVDPAAAELTDRTDGGGYLQRQVALWSSQWERNQTRTIPALDQVARKLRSTIPTSPRVSIIHGDYKLDNVLFAREAPARLKAILDWEMATIGDPLADVGYLTATWVNPGESPERLAGLSSATSETGFPRRRELAERYAKYTDLGLEQLAWYQALALWKLAILLETGYRRYLAGTTSDEFLGTLKHGVPTIAEQALAAVAGSLV